jgi:hypothetical protein
VKRKDEARWGEYRTKRVILEVYDAMRRAMNSGVLYRGDVLDARLGTDVTVAGSGS